MMETRRMPHLLYATAVDEVELRERQLNAKSSLLVIVFSASLVITLSSRSSKSAAISSTGSSSPNFHQLTIPVGKEPAPIALADVNHDGNLDIMVANSGSRTLTVLLGDGKGHFTSAPGSSCATGPGPNDIAIADFDHDGNPDVVIANTETPYLTILLGDGKGGFKPSPHSPFATQSHPHTHGVAAADFNGDGKIDVVTDSWGNNQIILLLGDGRGNLMVPGELFNVGKRPYQRLRSADFNKDGKPDVVTTNLDGNNVTILLGDGRGGFQEAPSSPSAAGVAPWAVAIDDLNKDGNPDLAILPYDRDVTDPKQIGVTVLLGNGKGGFATVRGSPFSLAGCRGPDRVATGDLNGDGHRDLVVSCAQSNNLVFFLGTKDGNFPSSTWALKDIGWSGLAVGDLNGDGKDDVVVANNASGTVTVLLSK
jgi:hypothetical protein